MNLVSMLSNAATRLYSNVDATGTAAATSDTVASPSTAAAATPSTSTSTSTSTDQATLSSVALQLSRVTSYATQLFATRPGMSNAALAMAPANPGLASSSKGLTLPEVATDARARMDDKYAQMKASGVPYDGNSQDDRDTHSLLGDLDRRSLYAVSSNASGLFTPAEQQDATNAMNSQMGLAMGLYSGPTALVETFVDPYKGDDIARFKAGLSFLNNVSNEEKGSASWMTLHKGLEESVAAMENPKKSEAQQTLFDILAEMNSPRKDDVEEKASTAKQPASSPAVNANTTTTQGTTSSASSSEAKPS